MTLLFFDGFQDAVLMPKEGWAGSLGAVGTGRDGSTNGSVGGTTTARTLNLTSAAATCVCGFAMLPTSFALGTGIPQFSFYSSGTVRQLTVMINSSGMIEARKGTNTGTLLGTSSGHTPIALNDWPHIQVKALLHLTTGSVQVKLYDITVLTVSGVSTSTVTGSVTQVGFLCAQGNAIRMDDLYVCDIVDATATQGQPNNDFLGDLRVAALFPSAAGDTTQWTPSTGTNFSTVDETPPNTTDFVSTSTSGNRDLYQTADPASTVGTVFAVQQSLYASKTDAGSAPLRPVLKENSVVTADTAEGPSFGSWVTIWGQMRAVRPSDNALWTASDINNLQIGQEIP